MALVVMSDERVRLIVASPTTTICNISFMCSYLDATSVNARSDSRFWQPSQADITGSRMYRRPKSHQWHGGIQA